jgi:hypothetical protein
MVLSATLHRDCPAWEGKSAAKNQFSCPSLERQHESRQLPSFTVHEGLARHSRILDGAPWLDRPLTEYNLGGHPQWLYLKTLLPDLLVSTDFLLLKTPTSPTTPNTLVPKVRRGSKLTHLLYQSNSIQS